MTDIRRCKYVVGNNGIPRHLHGPAVRNPDEVIGAAVIKIAQILGLLFHDADNLIRFTVQLDILPDSPLAASVKLGSHIRADNGHLLPRSHIRIEQVPAVSDLIALNIQVFFAVPAHGCGIHGVRAVLDRDIHRHVRRHLGKEILMFLIKLIELVDIYGSGGQSRIIHVDLIHAHAGETLHHVGHLPVDDAHQDNDGGNADDDPEHRQKRTHFVAPDAP